MKLKPLAVLAVSAAVAGGAVLHPGVAHADTDTEIVFTEWAHTVGFTGGDEDLVHNAHFVCHEIDTRPGYTAGDAGRLLYVETDIEDVESAEIFAHQAVIDFCPEFLPGGSENP